MKLSEIKTIAESKMSERHQDLQDAVQNEFGCSEEICDQIVKYLTSNYSEYDFKKKHPEAYQVVFDATVEEYGARADNDTMFKYTEKLFSKFL
jgi:hypothetical protein